jgi:hypothetical protein
MDKAETCCSLVASVPTEVMLLSPVLLVSLVQAGMSFSKLLLGLPVVPCK